jgi:hypothetical protein
MYISLEDSCAKGFRKWADAHEPKIKKDVRAGDGDGVAAAHPDLDNGLTTSAERPHRPWLVPGSWTL